MNNEALEFVVNYLRAKPQGKAPAEEVIKAGQDEGFGRKALTSARIRARNPRISTQQTPWVWAIDIALDETSAMLKEGGKVVYCDSEYSPSSVRTRLKELGVPQEAIRQRLVYIAGHERAVVEEYAPDLLVIEDEHPVADWMPRKVVINGRRRR